MLSFQANRGIRTCDGLSRREFLHAGALTAGAAGLSLAGLAGFASPSAASAKNCIVLFLVGGPSQLDTWDPKPSAPVDIRGPFRPIATRVPGIQVAEHFPLLARTMDRVALVRSVYHGESPIHETGQQLLQTGRLAAGVDHPNLGSMVSYLQGSRRPDLPASMVLPGPMGNTGVSLSHGQGAGFLGGRHEALVLQDAESVHGLDPARPETLAGALDRAQFEYEGALEEAPVAVASAFATVLSPRAKNALWIDSERESVRDRYGRHTFGQSCLLARRMVEAGVRFVTVNMFDTVFNAISWDCHADGGALAVTLDDYRTTLCPMFDQAYTALLIDLEARGLFEDTLVVAMGEFGRTPRFNFRGGRDHWPSVWTILMAGGGVRGGQVIGASDSLGMEPRDRPVHASEVASTIHHALGLDPAAAAPGPDGQMIRLMESRPVLELF